MRRPDFHAPRFIFRILAPLAATALHCAGQVVYRTDFENFQVGPGNLVGTEGWSGNSFGGGWQGIDADAVPGGGLGKTAFIGYSPPTGTTSNVALVYRSVNLDPATNSQPIIEFESLLGIKDSTSDLRDDFVIAFYNISPGTRLAQIRFQNASTSTWIWRGDGVALQNTFMNFLHGELHLLYVRLDLVTNRWSAFLDGIPLFNGAQFTATGATRTLGSVGVEWRRGPRPAGVTTWGDNWMLIADWSVRMAPFELFSTTRDAGGAYTLKWIGDPGRSYQVQHTDNPSAWESTLPGSAFPGQTQQSILSFTDPSPPPGRRFYRVRRD
jgi:hypothetical protein